MPKSRAIVRLWTRHCLQEQKAPLIIDLSRQHDLFASFLTVSRALSHASFQHPITLTHIAVQLGEDNSNVLPERMARLAMQP
jgi:hypothetical protein